MRNKSENKRETEIGREKESNWQSVRGCVSILKRSVVFTIYRKIVDVELSKGLRGGKEDWKLRETLRKYRYSGYMISGFSPSPVNSKSPKKVSPKRNFADSRWTRNEGKCTLVCVSFEFTHRGIGGCGRINGYHTVATSNRNCFYVRARRVRGEGKNRKGTW